MVLFVCGLANAADAVEILSVGLLGTAAETELNLTPQRTGALNACIFVGMFLVSHQPPQPPQLAPLTSPGLNDSFPAHPRGGSGCPACLLCLAARHYPSKL